MKFFSFRLLNALVLLLFSISANSIGFTGAVFSDQATVSGSSVSMGDWTAPYVKIEAPDDLDVVSGSLDIYGTVTDNDPHHYWLVVQTPGGTQVAGPGTVNESNSFTNQLLHTWDTTAVADGDYIIKLEARDAAGNKDPDLAPVLSDPEDPNDSVDWITVTVNNQPDAAVGAVVINEVMWMGSTTNTNDEWIELRNMTNNDIEIGKWTIENAKSSHGTYMLPANKTIPANGYFLIANYPKSSANTNLNVDPDVTNAGISLANSGNGNLVLKDTTDTVIDEALGDPSWPKGQNTPDKRSMERNSSPTDGTQATDWHQCDDAACNDGIYWDDADGDNYGTPKDENHSENDPSLQQQEQEDEEPTVEALTVQEDGDTNTDGDGGNDGDNNDGGDGAESTPTDPENSADDEQGDGDTADAGDGVEEDDEQDGEDGQASESGETSKSSEASTTGDAADDADGKQEDAGEEGDGAGDDDGSSDGGDVGADEEETV